jgi:hypothetical protein
VHNEVDSLESVISEWDSSLKNIPGRPPRHQRHRACSQERLPLVRLPGGLWSADDDL